MTRWISFAAIGALACACGQDVQELGDNHEAALSRPGAGADPAGSNSGPPGGTDANGTSPVNAPGAAPALVEPACDAPMTAATSAPDQTLYINRKEDKTLTVLGAGQVGGVSFRFEAYSCSDVYNGHHYAKWRIRDGNGGDFNTVFGGQDFQNLTLPVTISAYGVSESGYFPGNICAATGLVKNITYATTKSSCITAPKITAKFQQASWEKPIQTIGSELTPGTKLTFSAAATFFDNFTAPNCAQVVLSGRTKMVTLTRATAQTPGLVELDAPLWVRALPTCASSTKSPPQNASADFEVTFSQIALGPAQ